MRLQALPIVETMTGQTIRLAVIADGGNNVYRWTWQQTNGTPATFSGENTNILTVKAPTINSPETLDFKVTVTDGLNKSVSETVQVSVLVAPSTQPLSLVLIPNQSIDEGQTDVTIPAVAKGGTGQYSYNWQIKLPTSLIGTTLTDSNTSIVRFDAPQVSANTLLHFILTVNDGSNSVSEEVLVNIKNIIPPLELNLASTAMNTVHSGDMVALSVGAPNGGQGPYTYVWTQTGGSPSVSLSNTNTISANFAAPSVTQRSVLTFKMTVTDSIGNVISATDSVAVIPAIPPLTATLTGPASIGSEEDLTLNVAVTGGTPSYTYSTTGAQATIPQNDNPTFKAPKVSSDTIMTVNLVLSDSSNPVKTQTVIPIKITIKGPVASTTNTPLAPTEAAVCGIFETTPCTAFDQLLGSQVTCDADKPYAMTDIIRDSGVPNRIYKRCVNEATCYMLWYQGTSDKSVCMNFDSQADQDLDCHFCCYAQPGQPPCNADIIPPVSTQFRP